LLLGNAYIQGKGNQQPRPEGTRYVVLKRYLHSGFNTFFKRLEGRGIKPLSTNKCGIERAALMIWENCGESVASGAILSVSLSFLSKPEQLNVNVLR